MSFIDYNFRTKAQPVGNNKPSGDTSLAPARVIDIIMDDEHPDYDTYGGPNSIGMVYYRFISQEDIDTSEEGESEYTGQAFPLTTSHRLLPLKNEIILLTFLKTQSLVDTLSWLIQSHFLYFYSQILF